MRDSVLWRKDGRIVAKLAELLSVTPERALGLAYSTQAFRQLADPKYGMQLMSDGYILEDIVSELRKKQQSRGATLTERIDV